MDFMYGKLNKIVERVDYTGSNSSTVDVLVNNDDRTIQANLKAPVPTASGTYVLTVNVSDGALSYTWSTPTSPEIENISNALNEHLNNFSNPHQVTKEQVGLGSVVNAELDNVITENSSNYITSGAVYTAIVSALNTPV